ncbi:MAG: trehalose-6-phosphate synthase [Dichotomicrobium sp.]
MSRIIAVSNRVPFSNGQPQTGGLAVALEPVLRRHGGVWFGWDGEIVSSPMDLRNITEQDGYSLATIKLSQEEHRCYYLEYANRTLWPLFHGRTDLARYDPEAYATYRRVNERFARYLRELARPDDRIWVHDYHLIPLGQRLRDMGVNARIGFFLHIPFPAPEVLDKLPRSGELVDQLQAYDLVGFQTEQCRRNFEWAAERFGSPLAAYSHAADRMRRRSATGAFPISIDTRGFEALASSASVADLATALGDDDPAVRWICSVDRLDYTKGLPEKLQAFELFLEETPTLHGKVSLAQVAAPSRETIPEYDQTRRSVEALVSRINERFGTPSWLPVHYVDRAMDHAQVAALFRRSAVCLVTPLRDGMNLVAKEYIAAQDPDDPGVLILSRFAGAAHELAAALIVDPGNPAAVARAIKAALQLPASVRRPTWARMFAWLRQHDVHSWQRNFLAALERAVCSAAARTAHKGGEKLRAHEPVA